MRIAIVTGRPKAASVRGLAQAAAACGHALEAIDLDEVSLSFEAGAAGLAIRGQPAPHYDAVIPRVGERGQPFAAAVVRQMELMGGFAVNPGDALDTLRDPLAVLQRLVGEGLPARAGEASREAGLAPLAAPSALRFLVLGTRVIAALETRDGRDRDASARPLEQERAFAADAAAVLRLGLAAIHVSGTGEDALIAGIDAVPPLSAFERVTGVPIARAIVAFIESRAPGVSHWDRA